MEFDEQCIIMLLLCLATVTVNKDEYKLALV